MMIRVVLAALATVSLSLGLLMTYAKDPGLDSPLDARLEQVDGALARGDGTAAARARHEAYVHALGTARWEDMLAAGSASLRVGEAAGTPGAGRAEAREAYLAALNRARASGSTDGVLRVAEAFAALGDRSVAEQCLVIAARLAGESRDGEVVERVRAASERLEERLRAEAGDGGWHR
jgi:hypothetical protein